MGMELADLKEEGEENRVAEVGVEVTQAQIIAKDNPDFLSALAMPETTEYNLPPVYLTLWSILTGYAQATGRLFKYFALGLPRGFGKTTLIKLFCLWLIIFSKKQFILILSENVTKASNIISDIMDMLSEPNIKAIFGDWEIGKETDRGDLKKFHFRGRDIIIAGLGVGGSVRGLNLKNRRPDVILMDDIQSREDADSEVISKGIMRWMQGTVMKAKSEKGCLTLFIANMYPTPFSILKSLQKNPFWEKIIAGGILTGKDGKLESLWEDLKPLTTLLEEYEFDKASGQTEIFHAEVLNDPNAKVNNIIDIDKIPELPYEESDRELHQGNFIVIDPATDKANADKVSIGYFQVYDSTSVLWDLVDDRLSPKETIKKSLGFAVRYNCRCIVVEGTAYQSTLRFWFEHFINELGLEGITVLEIYPGRSSKNSRILTMFKQLTGGSAEYPSPEIYLHPRVRTAVIHQIRSFDHLKTNNVDNILDVLTYSPRVLNEFSDYIRTLTLEMEQADAMNALIEYNELDTSPI